MCTIPRLTWWPFLGGVLCPLFYNRACICHLGQAIWINFSFVIISSSSSFREKIKEHTETNRLIIFIGTRSYRRRNQNKVKVGGILTIRSLGNPFMFGQLMPSSAPKPQQKNELFKSCHGEFTEWLMCHSTYHSYCKAVLRFIALDIPRGVATEWGLAVRISFSKSLFIVISSPHLYPAYTSSQL